MTRVEAYRLAAGDRVADGREIVSATIAERGHEWLVVYVAFTDGSTATYDFYTRVELEEQT